MPDCYRAPGGWRVEVVRLEDTPDRHDGTWLRVTQFGWWTADLRSVVELERFFPLGELQEDDGLERRKTPERVNRPLLRWRAGRRALRGAPEAPGEVQAPVAPQPPPPGRAQAFTGRPSDITHDNRTVTERVQPALRVLADLTTDPMRVGLVSFDNAKFSGGQVGFGAKFLSGQVSFDGAEFSGGQVNFRSAKFSGGQVSFHSAEFLSGGQVSFGGAEFLSGGQVSFGGAEFLSGGQVSFDGAKFSGGAVDFGLANWSVPPRLPPWHDPPPGVTLPR
jgi:hypothetical protein